MVNEVKEPFATAPSLIRIKLVMTIGAIPNSIEIRVIWNTMHFAQCPLFSLLWLSQFVSKKVRLNALIFTV